MNRTDESTRKDRRRFLTTAVAGFLGASAGCLAGESTTETATRTGATDTATVSATSSTRSSPTPTREGGPPAAVETVATGLAAPWDVTAGPDGSLWLTEVGGRIHRVRVDRPGNPITRLATLESTRAINEGGLLGIALHPEFPDRPSVYVYQTYDDGGLKNRILRLRHGGGSLERRAVVIDGIPGSENHDGGRIAFGPDGTLYATTGDASQGSPAQDTDSLAGKILRLAPDGSVPSDNPFDGSPVWSYGHRNSQGIAWDPEAGQLYATEHSSDSHDELNRIRPGENYGWPAVIGDSENDAYTDPVLESGEDVWAPAGAAFYDGSVFPRWRGDLFFCTLGFSPGNGRHSLHRVAFEEPGGRAVAEHERLLAGRFGRLRAVTGAPDGTLYVTTSNRDGRGDPDEDDDRLLRLAPDRS